MAVTIENVGRLGEIADKQELNTADRAQCMFFAGAMWTTCTLEQTLRVILGVLQSNEKVRDTLLAWLTEVLEPTS